MALEVVKVLGGCVISVEAGDAMRLSLTFVREESIVPQGASMLDSPTGHWVGQRHKSV